MQKFFLLSILVLFASCNYFQSQEKQTRDRVNADLLAVDWNDVDQYPLFDNCDELSPKQIQRECFKENLLNYFSAAFNDLEFVVEEDINDTLYIDFLIDEDGFMTVLEIQEKNTINKVLPELKEQLSERLNNLTTVAPALKHANPVSIKFRLPLVLNTTN